MSEPLKLLEHLLPWALAAIVALNGLAWNVVGVSERHSYTTVVGTSSSSCRWHHGWPLSWATERLPSSIAGGMVRFSFTALSSARWSLTLLMINLGIVFMLSLAAKRVSGRLIQLGRPLQGRSLVSILIICVFGGCLLFLTQNPGMRLLLKAPLILGLMSLFLLPVLKSRHGTRRQTEDGKNMRDFPIIP